MTFWPLSTIIRWFARPPELAIPSPLWTDLLAGLRARGQGKRESGAFLLGPKGPARRVTDIVYYDEIDPRAFVTGIVVIDGGCMADLWRICRSRGLTVVADVHTHPGGAGQSDSDRQHPMVAEPGHLAMIIPNFAAEPVRLGAIGFYRYLGSFRWETLTPRPFRPTLEIGDA